jgi:hypothetical protein
MKAAFNKECKKACDATRLLRDCLNAIPKRDYTSFKLNLHY